MTARNDLNEALQLIPLRSQKTVLTILEPYFKPEMFLASFDYLEQLEQRPLGTDEISEIIFRLVSDLTGVTTFRKTKSRKSELVFARQLAMFALYTECHNLSLQKVANLFLIKFNHATVLHGIKSMEARYSSNKGSREIIDALASLMAEHSLTTFKGRLKTIELIA
jgi:hypothetical protein